MNETTEILKVDEAGRVRTPREKQEEVLDGFEQSGMTGMQFARHIGVKYPTLMNWVQRRRRERKESAGTGGPRWLEAVLETPQGASAGMVVEVPGGLRLIVKESEHAKIAGELLRVLEPKRSEDRLPKAARRVSGANQFGQPC